MSKIPAKTSLKKKPTTTTKKGPQDLCASCGNPRKPHSYRHVFVEPVVLAPIVLAHVWATKGKKGPDYMPDTAAVLLEGDAKKGLLFVSGWSTSPGDAWPKDRLEKSLARIKLDWAEEFGTGWKLEILDTTFARRPRG